MYAGVCKEIILVAQSRLLAPRCRAAATRVVGESERGVSPHFFYLVFFWEGVNRPNRSCYFLASRAMQHRPDMHIHNHNLIINSHNNAVCNLLILRGPKEAQKCRVYRSESTGGGFDYLTPPTHTHLSRRTVLFPVHYERFLPKL